MHTDHRGCTNARRCPESLDHSACQSLDLRNQLKLDAEGEFPSYIVPVEAGSENRRNAVKRKILILVALLGASAALPLGAEQELVQLPDLKIVGWRVDDASNGNGDAGLHPGERARLYVTLSNQGNEPARDIHGAWIQPRSATVS